MNTELKILELFAGVGGFRVGFENSNKDLFKTEWANQWEPSKKSQDAFEVYNYHFYDSENINKSIADISDEEFKEMNADIIVGGFPCQDYSVARSKKGELGLQGKKGVLFWEIIRAVINIKPKYLVLENVDRLLKSPSTQRGRDFAVMLAAFNELNYSVEWRVINAADYGRAQRRKRVFFFIYRNDTEFAKKINQKFEGIETDNTFEENLYENYIYQDGLFARQFPVENTPLKKRCSFYELPKDIIQVSDNFSGKVWNTGIMRNGRYFTIETIPKYEEPITLKEIVQDEKNISDKFYLNDNDKLEKFAYMRGSKKIKRISSTGHEYTYSEGGMAPYDSLDLPARTMLTSEGSMNRSTHLLNINNKFRILTPIEAERLQDFPDDWTKYKLSESKEIVEVSDSMRMFFMGNALVTGVVKRIADEIQKIELEQ